MPRRLRLLAKTDLEIAAVAILLHKDEAEIAAVAILLHKDEAKIAASMAKSKQMTEQEAGYMTASQPTVVTMYLGLAKQAGPYETDSYL